MIFESSSGPAAIQFDAANNVSHEISASIWMKSDTEFYGLFEDLRLTLSGGQTWAPNRTLTARSGTLRYNLESSDLVIVDSGNTLVINDGAAVELAGEKSPLSGTGSVLTVISHVDVMNNSTRGLSIVSGNHQTGSISGTGNTTVAAGSTLTTSAIRQSTLTLAGAGSRAVVRQNGTSAGRVGARFTGHGRRHRRLDREARPDQQRRHRSSSAATKTADFNRLYNQLKQGFNDGNWTGHGITSTVAAGNAATPTQRLRSSTMRSWANTTSPASRSTANSILLKYTYYGDIDLNGQVDADDLTVFANNFGRLAGATQVDGDIDFNGAVNADDLTVFANNFGKGVGNPLAVTSVQAVPEPSTVLLAALGAALLVIRSLARGAPLGKVCRVRPHKQPMPAFRAKGPALESPERSSGWPPPFTPP